MNIAASINQRRVIVMMWNSSTSVNSAAEMYSFFIYELRIDTLKAKARNFL